jgi:deazaflavin-dependent oxidoreductase (nitroreductase family)
MADRTIPKGLEKFFSTPLPKLMQFANTLVYRMSGGRVGGRMGRAPILLLTVRGRKTGKPQTVPLLYQQDGTTYAIVASKGGFPKHPIWYLNLQANPDVTVEVGRQKLALKARTASDEERERLWPGLVAMYPDYANYQSWSDRKIPVVLLEARTN